MLYCYYSCKQESVIPNIEETNLQGKIVEKKENRGKAMVYQADEVPGKYQKPFLLICGEILLSPNIRTEQIRWFGMQ